MKKVSYALLVSLFSAKVLATTVHDPQVYAQAIKQLEQMASQYGKEIAYWQEQLNHLKEQGGLLKNQLASLTGLRELGDLEGDLLSLMKELKGIEKHRERLNALLRSENPQDNDYANDVLSKYQMFNLCKGKGSQNLDRICKQQILNKAGTIEAGEEIRRQTELKIIEAAKIALKVKNAKDLKEAQDLSNAIALKDLEIKQLKNQWDRFVDESHLRDQLMEEKRREAFHEHQRNAPLPNIQFKS